MVGSFWNDFLKWLEREGKISKVILSLLKQTEPIKLTNEKITINAENRGLVIYLKKKLPSIERKLKEYTHKKLSLQLTIIPPKKKKKKTGEPLLKYASLVNDVFNKAGLNPQYNFDSFAVSNTNQVAFAAAKAVSEKPGHAYNPLFFYGGVGVGKTHLAQAIARKVLNTNPDMTVLFSPGDRFTNELIESIRRKNTPQFRRKYRKLDLLIIDDVQFIGGKTLVQEEFFHTFNSIVSLGGQIILTSDRPPYEIKRLEDRLRSRFSGGLIVDIQPPNFELRTAILLIKAREKNIHLDIELAKIIADNISDTRSLEGVLLSVYAQASSQGETINIQTIENFFRNKEEHQTRNLSPEDIIHRVCSFYNLKKSWIKSPSRRQEIAHARQLIMFLLRKKLKLKFEQIAFLLKRKDHTTVIYGVSKIENRIARETDFKREVGEVVDSLMLST